MNVIMMLLSGRNVTFINFLIKFLQQNVKELYINEFKKLIRRKLLKL